ncbi:MAG TPA: ATP-binding protein [Dehalococcoidales bacterium]|nr:ATP-binding protein [Dehalococcoidales bacterium]
MTTESGGRTVPREGNVPGLTPEESALVVRIGVFVKMRWLAIAGVLIASLLATQVFHIRFSLVPTYIICVVVTVYNFLFLYQAKHLIAEASGSLPETLTVPLRRLLTIPKATSPLIEKARAVGNVHIIVDLAALTVLLHYTGGIENPFIFYFVFHVILAGILLHYRVAYLVATWAILLVLLLVGLEYYEVIPHVHLEGFAVAGLYQQGSYILSVIVALSTCLYASAYMVTSVSGELRKRQREVVTLQQKGLTEKTRELEEASEELNTLEESRQHLLRFLAIASHDLKAPLSAVQSYIQLMLGGFSGELTDKQRQMLERSSIRITEQLELISDLLDISRIEGGQIVKEMEEMSLVQVVDDSVENVRAMATDKNIKLSTRVPASLPMLKASSVRLKQAITNLLVNAIKFTPENGEVLLRVTEQNGDIHTEVLDTGVGISAEDMPKIFDDFYRGSDREKAGSGLGLSIVKRVVEAHGGKIWAESPNPEDKKGRGSRFTFMLPRNLAIAGKKTNRRARLKSQKT